MSEQPVLNKTVFSRWIKRGTNTFVPTDNSETVSQVEAGLYDLRESDGIGFYMFKKEIFLDELLEFPSSVHSEVITSIKQFWTRREKFQEYGFAFKRGILLHGKAGTGKTCTINICMKYAINDLNAVVFSLGDRYDLRRYSSYIPEIFRVIEKDRPILVIIEDIENLCADSESEGILLNMLDGLDQLENVVYLATTNYIEALKERIINRPSRFDRRIYVPHLNFQDRLFYFTHKLTAADRRKIDIEQWSRDTDGMSIAHLAELIKSVVIFDNGYCETLDMLKKLQDIKSLHSSNYEKSNGSIGFTSLEKIRKQ